MLPLNQGARRPALFHQVTVGIEDMVDENETAIGLRRGFDQRLAAIVEAAEDHVAVAIHALDPGADAIVVPRDHSTTADDALDERPAGIGGIGDLAAE